jgi:hypothetical protein
MDSDAFNFDPAANIDAGGCIPVIYGCNLAETADGYPTYNHNPIANTHDGSCEAIVGGCIDPAADNYLVASTPMHLDSTNPAVVLARLLYSRCA